jgi:two-component system response regulator AtoC
MAHSVLVIDDDASTPELLAARLDATKFSVIWTAEPEQAQGLLRERSFDAVLTDVQLERLDGIALCSRLLAEHPGLPVVVMTAFGSIEMAVRAMRAGASDFLTKPIDLELFAMTLERAITHASLRREVADLRRERRVQTSYGELIGASHAMQAVYEMVERAAPSGASVLISGESGTGKEVLARTITQRSARADGPFIAVNCAALPEALLESELFGHAKGAFTSAHSAREGLLAQAAHGTLFLDEVGELPLALQPKLLRVLQERVMRPVGSDKQVAVDVRLICATNRDLEVAIAERRFRPDLYYRINVIHIALPRLAARGDDVLVLARHFLTRFGRDKPGEPLGLTPDTERALSTYPWPGNVRELANCIERAVVLARGRSVTVEDLPEKVRDYRPQSVRAPSAEPSELVALEEIERRYILHVLEAVHGNKSRAAQVLGLDRKTLYRRLERYGAVAASEHSNGAHAE